LSVVLKATGSGSVRFSEVDSLGIVWHGHYLLYLEEGRKIFGKKYNFDYLDIFNSGYLAPIVHVECNYKNPLSYGDEWSIETTYTDTPAAKLIFQYEITNPQTKKIVLTASTTQVFLRSDRQIELNIPGFFSEWKKKQKIISE